jgi:hypothetical protein
MKVPKSATLNSSRLQQRKNLVSELQDENDDEDDSTKNEKRKKEKKSLADILSKPAPSFQWLFPSVGSQNKKSENIKDVGQPQQPIDQRLDFECFFDGITFFSKSVRLHPFVCSRRTARISCLRKKAMRQGHQIRPISSNLI